MPVLYNMIYEQVLSIVRMTLEDKNGKMHFTDLIPDERWIKPMVHLISSLIFIFIALVFGVYLWNRGLVPAFPQVFAELKGSSKGQFKSPYAQFLVTFFALSMLF